MYFYCNLVLHKNTNYKNNFSINPWKHDVYSCAIIALILTGGIKSKDELAELDGCKNNCQSHDEKIKQFIKESKWNNSKLKYDEDLTQKMQLIIEVCLNYNPEQRFDFLALNEILRKIKEKNITCEEIQKICKSQMDLKENFVDLNYGSHFLFDPTQENIITPFKEETIKINYQFSEKLISENNHEKIAAILESECNAKINSLEDLIEHLSWITSFSINIYQNKNGKEKIPKDNNDLPKQIKDLTKIIESLLPQSNQCQTLSNSDTNHSSYDISKTSVLENNYGNSENKDSSKMYLQNNYTLHKSAEQYVYQFQKDKEEVWNFLKKKLGPQDIEGILKIALSEKNIISRILFSILIRV